MTGLVLAAFVFAAQAAYADDSTWLCDGRIVSEEAAADEREGDLKRIRYEKPGWNRLLDYSKGCGLLYPSHMYADVSVSEVKDVLFDANTSIEIYYDNFNGTLDSYETYRNYSNLFKASGNFFRVKVDSNEVLNGRAVHTLAWERDFLGGVPDDKPYYFSAEIKKNPKEVFTIMVKSNRPIAIGRTLVENFQIFEPDENRSSYSRTYASVPGTKSEEAEAFVAEILRGESVQWGLYHPGAPGSMISLNRLEKDLDYDFKGLIRYQFLDEDLPLEELNEARDQGKIVELTLQLIDGNPDGDRILELLNGDWDEYLEAYSNGLSQFGGPVLFRLNNEMNGDWCRYNALWLGKDTDLYKKAWIYIHDFMSQRDVKNLIWVWNPNDISYPGFKWNHWMNYFPGESYVDVIGLTGYNTGNYYESEKWRSFEEIYTPLYDEYAERFDYPFIVSEFGSNSVGGDKAGWILDMKDKLDVFKRIRFYFWFSGIDLDAFGNPARIYRIDESPEVMESFGNMLH